MKRKLVLTSAVVLILALLAAGTFAYFTKDARATNVITTGTIDITLNDEIRGGEKTGTGWKLEGVMPGQAVEKKVSITNNGSAEAWLRVKLAVRVTVDGEEMPLTFGDGQSVLLFATGDRLDRPGRLLLLPRRHQERRHHEAALLQPAAQPPAAQRLPGLHRHRGRAGPGRAGEEQQRLPHRRRRGV